MIPLNAIQEWKNVAPWADPAHVEQDLVITRALILLYSEPTLAEAFAFRGGTAMQKLFLRHPTRYSEDIDLVQLHSGPIGPALDLIRKVLDPWLGIPKRDRNEGRFSLTYRFDSETSPVRSMRLKVEVNNDETFTVFDLQTRSIAAKNRWFTGSAEVKTYTIEELLGTKLRALYQRKKGRDLYDLNMALDHFPELDPAKVIQCFLRYIAHQKTSVSRAQFEANLTAKIPDAVFIGDVPPLLPPGAPAFDSTAAGERIKTTFLARLPGEPWKGPGEAEGGRRKKRS